MLIPIKTHDLYINSVKSRHQLLFICQAEGENDAIPRIMHSHSDRLEIMFFYKGTGNYSIDGEFYTAKEGDILIFNSGSIHDEQPLPSKDLKIYSCGIANVKIKDLPLNHIIPKKHIPVINTGSYIEQFRQFFELFISYAEKDSSLQHEIIYYSTLSFLLLIHELFNERETHLGSKKSSLGQRIKEYIDSHFLADIDIDAISAALNVNRFYLSHVFKDFSGYSPKQYIIRRRIGEAQNLLLTTDHAVAEIAHKVGYPNVNNFHHIFEKVIGMPPGRYKKMWLNKN